MKFIRNWFENEKEKLVARVAYEVQRNLIHVMLADLGVEELEKIVVKAKANQKQDGQSNYSNLAELYITIMQERRDGTQKKEQTLFDIFIENYIFNEK